MAVVDLGRLLPALMLGLLALAGAGAARATALELREFPVGEFHRVEFSGRGTVLLSQSESPRLAVRAHPGALAALEVKTRDGVLVIDASRVSGELVAELQVARLSGFVNEGEGRIIGEGLDVDVLRLEGSGAGSFDLQRLRARELEVHGRGATRFDFTGEVVNQIVELDGSGAYRAGGLISDSVSVHVAGSSDVALWAEQQLDVEVAGTARIRYAGSPRVEQRVSGMARVQRIHHIAI